ncbi:MAG: hypothetical protein FD180_5208 [Planctomycetota bacterium]|nr:MAG: hypothetical protein FD180_5208 [Planctomycetota bacterium]
MTATQNVNVPFSPDVLVIPAKESRGAIGVLASAMGWVIGFFKAVGLRLAERAKSGWRGMAEAVVDIRATVKKMKSRPARAKKPAAAGFCVTPGALKIPGAWKRAG